MVTLLTKWGADYMLTDEPLNVKPVTLVKGDIELVPGMKVTQIGHKRRSMFALKEGFYMVYEGIQKIENHEYAIFTVPEHYDASEKLNYHYAFLCVYVDGKFNCFLRGGNGTAKGMADIQLDYLKTI